MSDINQQFIQPMKKCWPDFKISIQELQRPTSELVMAITERFLSDININIEQGVRSILSQIPESEAFTDIIYSIFIYKSIQQFLIDTNTPETKDFKVFSLLQPKRKSTHILLQFLKNYLLFKQNFVHTIDKIYLEKISISQKKDDMLRQIDTIKTMENNTAMKHATMMNLKEECMSQVKKLYGKLRELKQQDDKLTQEYTYVTTQRDIAKKNLDERLKYKDELIRKISVINECDKLLAEKNNLQKLLEQQHEEDNKLTVLLKEKAKQNDDYDKYIEHKIYSGISIDLSDLYSNENEIEISNKMKELYGLEQSNTIHEQTIEKEQKDIKNEQEELDNINKQWKDKLNELKYKQKSIEKEIEDIQLIICKSNENNMKLDKNIRSHLDKIKRLEDKKKALEQLCLKNYQQILDSNKKLQTKHQKYLVLIDDNLKSKNFVKNKKM